MGDLSNKNHVCSIFTKDENNEYHKLFSVEGDKPKDPSVYFYEWAHTLTNPNKQHFSYRSRQDQQGLVQVHLSEMKKVSRRQQTPLDQRDRIICAYHYNDYKLDPFPIGVPSQGDICLTIKPEHFSKCQYVFYVKEKGLKEYAQSKNLFVVNTYKIPVQYIQRLYFGVLIDHKTLSDIQSS